MVDSHDHNHDGDSNHAHAAHGHDHGGHGHSHFRLSPDMKSVPRALIWAMAVTLIFMVVEAVGGYVANSLALLTDAAHMLTDVGAMGLSLFVYWMARRPSNSTMTFGYYRAEILGALASGLLIWWLSGMLVYEAVQRLRNPPEVTGPLMLVIAVLGLVANLLGMAILHASQKDNLNVKGAYLHLVTDCIGSAGAIIAAGVLITTGWRPIDPIITLLSAFLMLYSSWGLVTESVRVLMESSPAHLNSAEIQAGLKGLDPVNEVHDLHIWTVSSGRLALSVHLVSDEAERALAAAHRFLNEKYGIQHTTIQVEHPEKFQSEHCFDCK